MIVIIRIQAQGNPELLWNDVLLNKDRLQEVLGTKGKMLYLSKRCNYNEVSLFVHVSDINILGDFIAQHLAKLEGVTGIWLINMLKPIFRPLPKETGQRSEASAFGETSPAGGESSDGVRILRTHTESSGRRASGMKRYTVTVKAYSPRLSEIYDTLANLAPLDDVSIGYLAYTCHLFGDCIQISLQAPRCPAGSGRSASEGIGASDGIGIQKYVDALISKIPGVLRTVLCEIEKTHPFVSYEEWQKYISKNTVLVDWDEQHMVAQFQN